MYKIICYEEVHGDGPVCWDGEQEYTFDDLDEATKFVSERMTMLHKPVRLSPGDQYVVTKSITKIEETTLDDVCQWTVERGE